MHGILSVDISDWTAPGSNGRPAMQCSREEVVRETWRQLKRSLNDAGDEVLRDEDLHSWFLDTDVENDPARPGWLRNSEPLLVNLVDTLGIASRGDHRHSEPVSGVGLRPHAYRPRDDGGSQ